MVRDLDALTSKNLPSGRLSLRRFSMIYTLKRRFVATNDEPPLDLYSFSFAAD
jgi:hypothetical protein